MTSSISFTCATLLTQLRAEWDYTTAGVLADAFAENDDPYNAALWYVLAEPHSDERRLAYAAECEREVEKFKTCSFCKGTGHKSVMRVTTECPFCKGIGRIRFREPRDAARAEFVRVQVELAKIGECPVCDGKGEFPNSSMQIPIQRCWICYDLRRRERELEKEAIRWVEEMLDKGINNGAG